MKEYLDFIFSNMNSEIVVLSLFASIIISIILIGAGLFYKRKGKGWWLILFMIGVAGIVINGIKYIITIFH